MNFRNTRLDRYARSSAAFSLVEQLVGMSVVGVMITSLFAGLSQGFAIMEVARENLRATQILCERAETIRLYTMEQITNSNFNGTNFMPRTFQALFYPVGQTNFGVRYSGTVSVTNSPITTSPIPNYNSNLIQLTFEVSWPSGGVTRKRSMSTYVARNGLQSYIY